MLVTLAGASVATFTVSVSGGAVAPAPIGRSRLHESAEPGRRSSPVPANAVAVRPPGSTSVTVMAAVVGAPPTLVTVIVYVAPIWPCEKLPVCVFVIVRSGPPPIVVESVAVLLPVLTSPPPATVAVLVRVAGALGATSTVSVSAGAAAPAAIAPLCVQESGRQRVQVQPAPLQTPSPSDQLGNVSVTVTGELVGTVSRVGDRDRIGRAVWPCEKLPVCVFAIVRSGPAPIVVGSSPCCCLC